MIGGMIFDIQRFSIHDGPGIRTTVFLKGCPLRCQWCHNPEGLRIEREIFFNRELCLGCGACASVCPEQAGIFDEGVFRIDRERCRLCLACADVCPGGAMEITGREISVDEVMREVEADRIFYEESGGGMTLSGGEPLSQPDFALKLLQRSRRGGIHNCVESSGFISNSALMAALPLMDLFLWDLKDTDPARHLASTGVPLEPILKNLRAADAAGAATILRCVIIPSVNADREHMEGIAKIFLSLSNCRGVELLPYHLLGRSKRERLGLDSGPSFNVPTPELMAALKGRLGELHIPLL